MILLQLDGVGRERVCEDLRHGIDDVKARQMQKRRGKRGFSRDDAQHRDVPHLRQPLVRARARAQRALNDLQKSHVLLFADRRVNGNDLAFRVRSADKFSEISDLFRRNGSLQSSVNIAAEPSFTRFEHRPRDGTEAVSDGKIAADAQDDGRSFVRA